MPQTNPSSASPKPSASAGAYNVTAYRMIRLLQWLQAGPLTVAEINERFLADSLIGKSISVDSIWLHLNTLRALGCRFRRPSASNGFRIQLLDNPLSWSLSASDWDVLVQTKSLVHELADPLTSLALDSFFLGLARLQDSDTDGERLNTFYQLTRTLDFEPLAPLINELSGWVDARTLLRIRYQPPSEGPPRDWVFLPQALCLRNGVLYLTGFVDGVQDLSYLRLDRIENAEPLADEPRRTALLQQVAQPEPLLLHFPTLTVDTWVPLGFQETVHTIDEPGVMVLLTTWDRFGLKQRLLSLAQPFHVLQTVAFRQEMLLTLRQMLEAYHHDQGHPIGR